jgi:hypothetical protein
MTIVNFKDLDFDQIKDNIKDYLRSNSNFTDYDFEGSNLSIIIDILAYNTYIASYNANMVSNEVFIDSATLRENVVSLARNIGYVPKSRTSAASNITFSVNTSNITSNIPASLILKAGEVCTTNGVNGTNFIFSIPEDVSTIVDEDGLATFENITIYEGSFVTENYTVSSLNPNKRYILGNSGIDTKSIRVKVRPTKESTIVFEYRQSTNLGDIETYPKVFFIQEVEDQKYEIIFGDGIFGEKLEDQNYIEISYIVTNGESANGISGYSFIGQLQTNNGASVTQNITPISTLSNSFGGSSIESVESVKKFAPRIYAAQNRAVTAADYESIVKQIYQEAESVSAFGGEELDPPQYGKIFITIKPSNSNFVADSIKDNIKSELRKYSVAGIIPEFIDLKFLYIEVYSSVYYNSNLVKDSNTVINAVTNSITNYSNSIELNRYGARFKYSKFLKIIDDSHRSVTSNITSILMRRDVVPAINAFANYEVCFGNPFHIKNIKGGYNIKSSGFKVSGTEEIVYFGDLPKNSTTGTIFLFRLNSEQEPIVVRNSVGTIDYSKGEIVINSVNVISTEKQKNGVNIIEISASPSSNDVIGKQDLYLQLDNTKTSINSIIDGIESGSDVSGFSYVGTSSYLNGSLVRV